MFFFLLFQLNASEKYGSIKGTVMDKNTRLPVRFASILLLNNNDIIDGTITNEKGDFSFNKIPLNKNLILEIYSTLENLDQKCYLLS